jgi:hypothetical protein
LKEKKEKKVPHLPPHPRSLILGVVFFVGKISPTKFQKLSDFGSFQSPKVKGKKLVKIARFLYLDFFLKQKL